MSILGIVVEYNPLHSGHLGHLSKSKEKSGCDTTIAVMSGNFVQRGEPAIWDKWRRTRMALEAGVDLVVELPLYYATGGAEYFARGAVVLLDKTGIVDSLCFGSEEGSEEGNEEGNEEGGKVWDIEVLKECALALLSDDNNNFGNNNFDDNKIKNNLKKYLGQGLSYPAARAKALKTIMPDIIMPDTPNNVLGVEYIRALIKIGSKIVPYTVPRSPGSAMEVRSAIKSPDVRAFLDERTSPDDYADLDNLSSIFHYILRTQSNLQDYMDVSEGLESRLIKCSRGCKLISEVISASKTKCYTYLRIQRTILHIILGITKKNMGYYEANGGPQYIRVLGFRKDRAYLLRMIKEKGTLPLVMNIKDTQLNILGRRMLEEETRSAKVYSLAYGGHVYFNEYCMPVVVM